MQDKSFSQWSFTQPGVVASKFCLKWLVPSRDLMFWSNSDCHLQLYCGLTAFWAFFFHQGMLLAIISSNKEVAAVNSSEKESRHFNEIFVISRLVWGGFKDAQLWQGLVYRIKSFLSTQVWRQAAELFIHCRTFLQVFDFGAHSVLIFLLVSVFCAWRVENKAVQGPCR